MPEWKDNLRKIISHFPTQRKAKSQRKAVLEGGRRKNEGRHLEKEIKISHCTPFF
jgi:hypothetical protein